MADLNIADRKTFSGGTTERKAVEFQYKFVEDGAPAGTFEGYGSVFGNEDDYGDVIQPGAFASVLAKHQAKGTMPKMLLNHGSMGSMFGGSDPMADLPIGKWSAMSEDAHGLQTKGRLINLDTESGKRIYGAMKENELNGLSIGYRVGDFVRGSKPNEPRRTIKTIKDLVEISPVTFPANELANIGAVKCAAQIKTIRVFEEVLRDVLGFSHAKAKAIAANGFKSSDPRDEDGAISGLLDTLVSVRKSIRNHSS